MTIAFTWYEYLIVGVYILIILGIGVALSRKGSENIDEYFLGGKRLPWWMLGISFMTSNLDLTGTMVIASFFAMVGLKGFLVELRGGTALPLALFMIFMAKWHRRAGVMTMAEWMEFRFGKDAGARAARLVTAIGIVILVLGMMVYFCVGFGKFLYLYFPFLGSPTVCAAIFTGIATLHILFSGLYGVAFTDVFQGALILLVVLFVAVRAFGADIDPQTLSAAWQVLGQENMTWEQWTSITPSWTMEFPEAYAAYNLFGLFLTFWVIRIFLEGFGGPLVPYAAQRFFAAKDDREASLTTGMSLFLFTLRWPLVIGVAVLGLGLGANMPEDPELVFPAVLGEYFPLGVRAVVVSCMIAAAMSTYDSTVNAGGAYIVNDIYRRFMNPKARPSQLMTLSIFATIGLSVAAVAVASLLDNINEIWGWLSMGFFGGMAAPMVLRWYWERLNGWGYTIGMVTGIGGALVQKAVYPQLVEWKQLAIIALVALVASVLGTLLTRPTAEETVTEFYKRTRPMGFWPRARRALSASERRDVRREHARDAISIPPALAFFYLLFMAPMYLVLHDWTFVGVTLSGALLCSAVLYFTWYKPMTPGR